MVAQNQHLTLNAAQAKSIGGITMLLVLVSFSMLFATLFMGYAALRFTAPVWPPMGMNELPMAFPIISTIAIGLSSLSFMLFEKDHKALWVNITFALGVAFSVCQFLLWAELKKHGIYAGTGVFASIIYAFTWIHIAHIFGALLLLLWPMTWARKQKMDEIRLVKINSIGKFWHFLGIVWILMFISLFLF